MNLRMGINRNPRLSATVYNNLHSFVEFKADIHNIYIRVHKDPTKQWRKIPFVAMDDVIFNVLEAWPPEWCAPDIAEIEKSAAQRKKDEAKLCIAQLAENRRKEEVPAEVRVVWDAAQTTTE